MSILNKAGTVVTYNLDIEQLKQIVIQDLGYTPKDISITSNEKCISSDPMYRIPPVYAFDGLKITITN